MADASMDTGSETSSPLVRQINNGNWLPHEEAKSLRAELVDQTWRPDDIVKVG
jgi:hypothetical protein